MNISCDGKADYQREFRRGKWDMSKIYNMISGQSNYDIFLHGASDAPLKSYFIGITPDGIYDIQYLYIFSGSICGGESQGTLKTLASSELQKQPQRVPEVSSFSLPPITV